MSRCCSNELGRLLAAAVGCAVPADKRAYGYISEHYAFGQNGLQAVDYAEDFAAAMLASTLGIDSNVDESWDEKREIFRNLRDLSCYRGKYGRCEFLKVCGGCRVRVCETTGDYLIGEHFCTYLPSE